MGNSVDYNVPYKVDTASGASVNPPHIRMFFAGIVWPAIAALLPGFWVFRFLRLLAGMREWAAK